MRKNVKMKRHVGSLENLYAFVLKARPDQIVKALVCLL